MINVDPGGYVVVTSSRLTPEQASDNLFPGMSVVLVDTEMFGHTVQYTFLVDYLDGTLAG